MWSEFQYLCTSIEILRRAWLKRNQSSQTSVFFAFEPRVSDFVALCVLTSQLCSCKNWSSKVSWKTYCLLETAFPPMMPHREVSRTWVQSLHCSRLAPALWANACAVWGLKWLGKQPHQHRLNMFEVSETYQRGPLPCVAISCFASFLIVPWCSFMWFSQWIGCFDEFWLNLVQLKNVDSEAKRNRPWTPWHPIIINILRISSAQICSSAHFFCSLQFFCWIILEMAVSIGAVALTSQVPVSIQSHNDFIS